MQSTRLICESRDSLPNRNETDSVRRISGKNTLLRDFEEHILRTGHKIPWWDPMNATVNNRPHLGRMANRGTATAFRSRRTLLLQEKKILAYHKLCNRRVYCFSRLSALLCWVCSTESVDGLLFLTQTQPDSRTCFGFQPKAETKTNSMS